MEKLEQIDSARARPPDFQILICTHDRADLLERTLESLNRAKAAATADWEIVVAANACQDSTVDRLRAYQERTGTESIPLRYFEVAAPGKSNALNETIPRLKATAVAFVDDDHRVDEAYLAEIEVALRSHPEKELFCGRILPDWDGREPEWVHDQNDYRIYPLPVPRFDQGDQPTTLIPGTATPGGGNLFMRTSVFTRVGEFFTDLGPIGHNLGGAEDIEWVKRAQARGIDIFYVPSVIQYHYVDATRLRLSYLLKKAYERSSSIIQVSEKPTGSWPPPYLYRKVLTYLGSSILTFDGGRRRFYLVRLAAALGEMKGFVRVLRDRRRGIRRGAK